VYTVRGVARESTALRKRKSKSLPLSSFPLPCSCLVGCLTLSRHANDGISLNERWSLLYSPCRRPILVRSARSGSNCKSTTARRSCAQRRIGRPYTHLNSCPCDLSLVHAWSYGACELRLHDPGLACHPYFYVHAMPDDRNKNIRHIITLLAGTTRRSTAQYTLPRTPRQLHKVLRLRGSRLPPWDVRRARRSGSRLSSTTAARVIGPRLRRDHAHEAASSIKRL
jgi:hypothetical protein